MGRFSRLAPLVPIVTPTYNQAQFIEETIRYVKAQDYPHIEHLILDDASTDHTREILQRYEGTYAMRWSAQAHEGQAAQIRRGFARAGGEIFAWLNSDDVYLPGAVSAAVEALQRAPDADLIYGNVIVIDGEGRPLGRRVLTTLDCDDFLGLGNCLAQPATFWTRDIYERVGGVNPNYYFQMDLDFFIRVAREGRLRHLRRDLAEIRMHADGKMVKADHIRRQELALLQQRYLRPGELQRFRYSRMRLTARQFLRYVSQGDLEYVSRRALSRMADAAGMRVGGGA